MVVEATALQRAQAHSRLLRKVKIEIERLREQEKVKTPTNSSGQSMLTSFNHRRSSRMQRHWSNDIRSSLDGRESSRGYVTRFQGEFPTTEWRDDEN